MTIHYSRLFLSTKCSVSTKCSPSTHLHSYACQNDSPPCVQVIADLNANNKYGNTFIHYAVLNNSQEMVQMLHNNSVSISSQCAMKKAPLHMVVEKNTAQFISFLTEKSSNANTQDSNGETPLHYAIKKCNEEIIDILLSTGASTNSVVHNNKRPLHLIATRHQTYIGYILFSADANFNSANKKIILQSACSDLYFVTLFTENTSNLDFQDQNRNTKAHIAIINSLQTDSV